MYLAKFINRHNLRLSLPVIDACKAGIGRMRKGRDPHHTDTHIYKIFDNLDYLLTSVPKLSKQINFNILLPAICWHDVWITNQHAKNMLHLWYLQLVEGRKSASMWIEYAGTLIDPYVASQIAYCIRKHSSIQIFPPFTREAKILIDLDKLEVWNIYRFIKKKNTIVSQKQFYNKYLVRLYYRYSWTVGLYFRELDKKLTAIRTKFFQEISNQ